MIEGLELWQLATLCGVGLVAAFINVMAGGGGLLTMPVLVFMGIPGAVANGTNRVSILAQNVIAVIAFFRQGYADFRLSLSLLACAVPGAVLGAMAGAQFSGPWFNRALVIIMLIVMALMYLGKDSDTGGNRPQGGKPSRRQLLWGHVLMAGTGLYGGFIQIGAGFIMLPILNRVMGLDLVHANMHKVFIMAGYSVVALAVFASQVQILWQVGLALALGKAVGGWAAAHIQVKRGEGVVRLALNMVLAAFIIKLLFFT